jgi:hypothetical protein
MISGFIDERKNSRVFLPHGALSGTVLLLTLGLFPDSVLP